MGIPGWFFRFEDLVYLDVGYNRFSGTLPDNIPDTAPDLRIMYMENNHLSGTIPSTLGNAPRMQNLFLHGNQLTGDIPAELANLKVLEAATFHFNDLNGNIDSRVCENQYQKQLETISVDCETMGCECCICGE